MQILTLPMFQTNFVRFCNCVCTLDSDLGGAAGAHDFLYDGGDEFLKSSGCRAREVYTSRGLAGKKSYSLACTFEHVCVCFGLPIYAAVWCVPLFSVFINHVEMIETSVPFFFGLDHAPQFLACSVLPLHANVDHI